MLKEIKSGGQTGVDRAALDVALSLCSKLGISVGGYCPKGRIAEDGIIEAKYPLVETTSKSYPERTKLNVVHSDGTLILSLGKLGKGTELTIKQAQEQAKPCFVVALNETPNYRAIIDWLEKNKISVLNIAGSRESSSPGIYKKAYSFLEQLLTEISLYFAQVL